MDEKRNNRIFYQKVENNYRNPLSQMDEMPNIEVSIFAYNPKTKKREEKRWEKCECYEEFVL